MNNIRIGVIGCGGIANGKHLPEIKKSTGGEVYAICDIDDNALHTTGEKYCIPKERRFKNYLDLIECSDVDAVDICTPNYLHCSIAQAAVLAHKPFCIEKPVGINSEEVKQLKETAERAGVKSMVCFSYRFMPAVRYAKYLIEQGILGKINAVYAQYLKSSAFIEGRRLDWRFEKRFAQYGVSGDLGVHLIDLATFLTGDIKRVCADIGIVVKERKKLDSEEYAPVETDDYCNFLAIMEGGASATFSITRCAPGNTNYIRAEVYGDKGGIRFNLNEKDRLEICRDGKMELAIVPEGFFTTQMQEFINVISDKPDRYVPTLSDGYKCQRVLDAILESAENNSWISLNGQVM
jgi:predicted dehydrogenase